MSKESKPKKTRSTKSNTADLEAKIAELEARLANLSDQVQPGATPAETKPAPKPQPRAEVKPAPRPTASGPTHGTLPAGFKPVPPPATQPASSTYAAPEAGEVAPAYATISSTEYTGNRYFATRKRLSYHPSDKQFTGSSTTTTTTTAPPPSPPAPEPERRVSQTRGTLPAGVKEPEKKSMWRSKGADYEKYAPQEERKAPPPPPPSEPSTSRGTLPAGFKPAPKPAPQPSSKSEEKPKPRPTASGPTHGTLPAGMKPAPKPDVVESKLPEAAGEVAPAYSTISSTEYTGNRYFATRKRMSYHPPNKQFTGSTSTTAPPPEPPKPKTIRGTLPAGFKP
ncbi:Uncharacterised protein [uncultured archaeon]|nr:Uncharacterised protein [uncultured archaeon]